VTEAKYDVDLPEQKVSCPLAQKKEGNPYAAEIATAPKVAFENGKTVSAHINWGRQSADAPSAHGE
jgi:hypothetical protein